MMMMMMNKISSTLKKNTLVGVSGFATSGKDTLYMVCKSELPNHVNTKRYAFADQLKEESDDFLMKNVGISAFTTDPIEKETIRPFLVTYGTHIRRKLNPNCWINRLEESIRAEALTDHIIFITDVRFENEAVWIKNNGGFLINVSREGIGPANADEESQSYLLKEHTSFRIEWPTVGSTKISELKQYISPILEKFSE